MRFVATILLAGAAFAVAGSASAQPPANLPACTVGMKLPLVTPINRSGTLVAIDAAKGSYQVKGEDGLTDWYPANNLRYSCAGVAAKPVDQSFFAGTWDMFVGPTAHNETIGGKGFLVVGPGGKSPPLTIRADGGYTWIVDSSTTITGRWRAMATSEIKYGGRNAPGILLLAGESGKNWQVTRAGVNAGSGKDWVDVERMDLGVSYQATRR